MYWLSPQINQQWRVKSFWNYKVNSWGWDLPDKKWIYTTFQEHNCFVKWGTPALHPSHVLHSWGKKRNSGHLQIKSLAQEALAWTSEELELPFLLSQVWFPLILVTTSNHFISLLLFFFYTPLFVILQMLCFKILFRGKGLCINVTNRPYLWQLKPCR